MNNKKFISDELVEYVKRLEQYNKEKEKKQQEELIKKDKCKTYIKHKK